MAVTAYNGPPGSGKSHALVKDVIVPAVLQGRRVVSNVDGLNPNAVLAYCLQRPDLWKVEGADKLGEVVVFHGEDARGGGFWPTEQTQKDGVSTFILPGDLVVFDEWAMYFPAGERIPDESAVEASLRWHRHLTHPETGVAMDVCIATQAITDFHRRHRPLLTRSFLFKNLKSIGRAKSYTWQVFDGRLQRKPIMVGHADYDAEIFPLYKSSMAAPGTHQEKGTNRKESIWGGWKARAFVFGLPLGFALCAWLLWHIVHKESAPAAVVAGSSVAGAAALPASAPALPPASPWHIMGHVATDSGVRVVLADDKGAVRMVPPDGFNFDETGRPISGYFEGRQVAAVETLPPASQGYGSMLGGMGQ